MTYDEFKEAMKIDGELKSLYDIINSLEPTKNITLDISGKAVWLDKEEITMLKNHYSRKYDDLHKKLWELLEG